MEQQGLSPNNLERETVSYPLATSPAEIISKVTRGH